MARKTKGVADLPHQVAFTEVCLEPKAGFTPFKTPRKQAKVDVGIGASDEGRPSTSRATGDGRASFSASDPSECGKTTADEGFYCTEKSYIGLKRVLETPSKGLGSEESFAWSTDEFGLPFASPSVCGIREEEHLNFDCISGNFFNEEVEEQVMPVTLSVKKEVCADSGESLKEDLEERRLLHPDLLTDQIIHMLGNNCYKEDLAKVLDDGGRLSFAPHLSSALARIIGKRLFKISLLQLDVRTVRLYTRRLFRPHTTVDFEYFTRTGESPLRKYIANRKQALRKDGDLSLRPYKRKTQPDSDQDLDDEMAPDAARLLLQEDLPLVTQGSHEYDLLLSRTWRFRVAFAYMNGPTKTFSLIPCMATDVDLAYCDFERKMCLKPGSLSQFALKWDNTWSAKIRTIAGSHLSENPEKRRKLLQSADGSSDVLALLSTLEMLCLATGKGGRKKSLMRYQLIFIKYSKTNNPMDVISYLRQARTQHPVIFTCGSLVSYYIALDGVDIQVGRTLGSALATLLAFTYLYNLKFPSPVQDFWSVVEKLTGIKPTSNAACIAKVFDVLTEES